MLKLTHALVHYGSMSHLVKRRVRDILPALRPGSMHPVTGYLCYLFGEPAGEHAGQRPVAAAPAR